MYGVDVLPTRAKTNNGVFAERDEGERIIANMLLATMVSQFYSEIAASPYVDYACNLAKSGATNSDLPCVGVLQIRSPVI